MKYLSQRSLEFLVHCTLLSSCMLVAFVHKPTFRHTSSTVIDASQTSQTINNCRIRTELLSSYLDSLERLKKEKSQFQESDKSYSGSRGQEGAPVNQLSTFVSDENAVNDFMQSTNNRNPLPDPGSASNIRQWWSQKLDTTNSKLSSDDIETPSRGVGSTASYLSRIGPSSDSKTQEYEVNDSSLNGSFGVPAVTSSVASFPSTSSYLNGILPTDETATASEDIISTTHDYSTDPADFILPVNTKLLNLADDILQRVEGLVDASNTGIDDIATTKQVQTLPSRNSPNEYSTIFGNSENRVEYTPSWTSATFSEFTTQSDELTVDQSEFGYLSHAISLVHEMGGERGSDSAFPQPTYAAVIVNNAGIIIGRGVSDFKSDAVVNALQNSGCIIEQSYGWKILFDDTSVKEELTTATLYVTLEPSVEPRGTSRSSIVDLINEVKISRVVIGSLDPASEGSGVAALNKAGVDVSQSTELQQECEELILDYAAVSQTKLRKAAKNHFERVGRPLGLLHCSVIDSDNVNAFARNGNAFGTSFGGKQLSYRNFGAYELAPPPDSIWAADESGNINSYETSYDDHFYRDSQFGSPIMPSYSQADAVVATFPRSGNGPPDDDSVRARLNGLRWLAIQGELLPPGVERILVLDATDLFDLPLSNDDPNLPAGVNVEAFWAAEGRKPTRIVLRRGGKIVAQAEEAMTRATALFSEASVSAPESPEAVKDAIDTIRNLRLAHAEAEEAGKRLLDYQAIRRNLESKGVIVETIEDGEPIDVMRHLGERSGIQAVVWRAGCWGERGVRAILAGAFQWVSAHLAVDAIGGKFWQLMIAESAIQAACGPQSEVSVSADEEDLSLEYCHEVDSDGDCVQIVSGRPVQHIRVDCRITLSEDAAAREELFLAKTRITDAIREKPWNL